MESPGPLDAIKLVVQHRLVTATYLPGAQRSREGRDDAVGQSVRYSSMYALRRVVVYVDRKWIAIPWKSPSNARVHVKRLASMLRCRSGTVQG